MLIRMVGKLLFKATLPLVILAGIGTYGVYMTGGDPGALWGGVADRVGMQARALVAGARDDATRAAGALSGSMPKSVKSEGAAHEGKSRVYKWVDADGLTHFSTHAPKGVESSTMMIDPNVNVLAPVKAPERSLPVARRQSTSGIDEAGNLPERVNGLSRESGSRSARASDAASSDKDMEYVMDQLGGRLPGMAGHVLNPQKDPATGVNAVELLNSLR